MGMQNDKESEDDSSEENECEHAMYDGMNDNEKINAMLLNEDKFEILMKIFVDFEQMMGSLNEFSKGWIISKQISLNPMKKINVFIKKKRKKKKTPSINLQEDDDENEEEQKNEKIQFVYDEFVPFEVCKETLANNTKIDEWHSFNECVDEFFSSHEANKNESKQTRAEMIAYKKLQTAKGQHLSRINKLEEDAENNAFKASVIEENLDFV